MTLCMLMCAPSHVHSGSVCYVCVKGPPGAMEQLQAANPYWEETLRGDWSRAMLA